MYVIIIILFETFLLKKLFIVKNAIDTINNPAIIYIQFIKIACWMQLIVMLKRKVLFN